MLVEKKYYKKIQLLFLIAGHTKNICDSSFSRMKNVVYRRNIYDYTTLLGILQAELKNISIFPVTAQCHFKRWGEFLDKTFKKNLEPGSIMKYHCFYFDETNDLTVTSKVYVDDPKTQSQRLVDKRLININKEKRRLRRSSPGNKKLNQALKDKITCEVFACYKYYLPGYHEEKNPTKKRKSSKLSKSKK